MYLLFSYAQCPALSCGVCYQGRDGLETGANELVDEGIPGRKWVESPKQDNNLLGYCTTL